MHSPRDGGRNDTAVVIDTKFIGDYPAMTTSKARPDFQAYTTRKRPGGQKDIWIDIGAGYLHQDGAGINVVLQATPIDGRVILRPMPDSRPADSKPAQSGA